MLSKVIGTLILGGGLGIPISATLRKTVLSEKIPNILRSSNAVVRLEWEKSGLREDIGKVIDSLGKKVNNKNESTNILKKPKVLALRLTTSGAFNEKICEKLGFNPGLKEPPINKIPNQVISEEYTKGIGCYTNLDI